MTDPRSYFASHMKELRQRLLVSFAAVVCATAIAYLFSDRITRLFMAPLLAARQPPIKLVYTNLTEAFVAYLKVSLLVGLIASVPILLYQLWMFVAPGLMRHEKKKAVAVLFWSTFLFGAGACFAYILVLPKTLTFFMGFSAPRLVPLPKLGGYLTFVARTSLAFGLAFEIPFLMVATTRTGVVAKDYFKGTRRYYYPLILILAVLLTAGDLFGAVLLATPLIFLYEAGILVIRLFSGPKNA
jgi:sec-independent protein translocase protein TatC